MIHRKNSKIIKTVMDSHQASSSSRPAKRNLNSHNVTPNVVGAPFAEESCSSRAPLCQPSARHQSDSKPTEESAISQHGGPNMNLAMHYLDNMHHATHWLKQHEIERKQTPLSHRLRSIKNGECLSILQQVSQAKCSSLRLVSKQSSKNSKVVYNSTPGENQSGRVQFGDNQNVKVDAVPNFSSSNSIDDIHIALDSKNHSDQKVGENHDFQLPGGHPRLFKRAFEGK